MAFDYKKARKDGYSDAEIADHLASKSGFDVKKAREDGYSDTELASHLVSQFSIKDDSSFTDKLSSAAGSVADTVKRGVTSLYGKVSDLNLDPAAAAQEKQIRKSPSVTDGMDGQAVEANTSPEARASMANVMPSVQADIDASRATPLIPGSPIRADAVTKRANIVASLPEDLRAKAIQRPGVEGQIDQAAGAIGTDLVAPAVRQTIEGANLDDAVRSQAYGAEVQNAEAASQLEIPTGREAFREENPLLSGVISGTAGMVQGTLDAVPLAADALNQIINPYIQLMGGEGFGQAARLPGAESMQAISGGYRPEIANKKWSELSGAEETTDWLAAQIAIQSPQLVGSTAAAMFSKIRGLYLGAMGAMSAGGTYQQNKEQGVDTSDAIADSFVNGGIEILTEMLPFGVFDKLKKVLPSLPKAAQATLLGSILNKSGVVATAITSTMGTGAVEEILANTGQNASSKYIAGNPNINSITEGNTEAGIIGALMGGPIAGVATYQGLQSQSQLPPTIQALSRGIDQGVHTNLNDANLQAVRDVALRHNMDGAAAEVISAVDAEMFRRQNLGTMERATEEAAWAANPINQALTGATEASQQPAGTMAEAEAVAPAAPIVEPEIDPSLVQENVFDPAGDVTPEQFPTLDPEQRSAWATTASPRSVVATLKGLPTQQARIEAVNSLEISDAAKAKLHSDLGNDKVEAATFQDINNADQQLLNELEAQTAEPTVESQNDQTENSLLDLDPAENYGAYIQALDATITGSAARIQAETGQAPFRVNPVNAEQAQAFAPFADAIQETFGSSVVPFSSSEPNAPDGVALNGKAHVNVANLDSSVAFVVGHEFFWHGNEQSADTADAAVAQWARANIIPMISEQGQRDYAELFLTKGMGPVGPDGKRGSLTLEQVNADPELRDLLESEMLGDFFGKRATDRKFLNELAKRDPSGFVDFVQKWIGALDKMIKSLKGKKALGVRDVDKYIKDLEKAKNIAGTALIQWRGNAKARDAQAKAAAPAAEANDDGVVGEIQFAKKAVDLPAGKDIISNKLDKVAKQEGASALSVVSSKPGRTFTANGKDVAIVKYPKSADIESATTRLHARIKEVLRGSAATRFLEETLNLKTKSIKLGDIRGLWAGEREDTFIIRASTVDGKPLPFADSRRLANILGFGFVQEGAVTSAPSHTEAMVGIPTVMIGKPDGSELTRAEVNDALAAANEVGFFGASEAVSGKGVKFLFFADSDSSQSEAEQYAAFGDQVTAVQKTTKLTASVDFDSKSALDSAEEYTQYGFIEINSDERVQAGDGQETREPNSGSGRPSVFRGLVDNILAPYVAALKIEGFEFDFDNWQRVFGAGKQETQYLKDKVAEFEDINKHGVVKKLRQSVSIVDVKDVGSQSVLAQTTTLANADAQLKALDTILEKSKDAASSSDAWLRMYARAYGTSDVPMAPNRFIKMLNSDGIYDQLKSLNPVQVSDADHGFEGGKEFRKLYESGKVKPATTAKLMLWSFLSRGVSPYVQESAFVELVSSLDPFVEKTISGTISDKDIADWKKVVSSILVKGTGQPGVASSHNANAFASSFMRNMAAPMPDGRSKMKYLHDLFSDPKQTGRSIRREFVKIGEGAGIDNKVISFTMLVIGHDDVAVLDRVQIANTHNDGRLGDYNLYDGVSRYGYEDASGNKVWVGPGSEAKAKASELAANGEPISATLPGSGMADLTTGVRGLLLYESIENALLGKLPAMYDRLKAEGLRGKEVNASPGRWHWESWVSYSGQEASHKTLEALLNEVKGQTFPFADVSAKEGEYGAYSYATEYAVDRTGKGYKTYPLSTGQLAKFTLAGYKEFTDAVKKPVNKVVPAKFKVTQNEDGSQRTEPWFNDPRVNRLKLDEVITSYAAIITDRTDKGTTNGQETETSPAFSKKQAGSVPTRGSQGTERAAPQGGAGAVNVTGRHYSNQERQSLDGRSFGTGLSGAERGRVFDSKDSRLRSRLYFYVDEGKGVRPEAGVGKFAHNVDLSNLYDTSKRTLSWAKDPNGDNGASANNFESAVLDAGYSGYYRPEAFGTQGVAILLGDAAIGVKPVKTPAFSRKQTETAEFKKWFGNSKVVDENGQPLVVYHGTPDGSFNAFDPSFISDGSLMQQQGPGFYFTDKANANQYTKAVNKYAAGTKRLYDVYLSLQNPLKVTKRSSDISLDSFQKLFLEGDNEWFFTNWIPFETGTAEGLSREAKVDAYIEYHTRGMYADEYDAKLLSNITRAFKDKTLMLEAMKRNLKADGVEFTDSYGKIFVAWSAPQIKSATGNNGQFDGSNPDIRFSKKWTEVSQMVLINETAKNKKTWGRHISADQIKVVSQEKDEGFKAANAGQKLNAAYLQAAKQKDAYDAYLKAVAEKLGLKDKVPGLKGRKRTVEKLIADYNSDVSKLKDMLRGTIETESLTQARELYEALRDVAPLAVVAGNDKSSLDPSLPAASPAGYRDAKLILDMNGVPAELIIAPAALLRAKDIAHVLYEDQRSLGAKLNNDKLTQSQRDRIQDSIDALDAKMAEVYAPAVERSQSSSASLRVHGTELSRELMELSGRLSGSKATRLPREISATGMPSKLKNLVPSGKSESGVLTDIVTTSEKDIIPQGKGLKFSRKDLEPTDFEDFAKSLDRVRKAYVPGAYAVSDKSAISGYVLVSSTPAAFKSFKSPLRQGEGLVGTGSTVYLKGSNQHEASQHNSAIPDSVLDNLPALLADPLAIYDKGAFDKANPKSNKSEDMYLVVLPVKVAGEYVTVAIAPNTKIMGKVAANFIKSVHTRAAKTLNLYTKHMMYEGISGRNEKAPDTSPVTMSGDAGAKVRNESGLGTIIQKTNVESNTVDKAPSSPEQFLDREPRGSQSSVVATPGTGTDLNIRQAKGVDKPRSRKDVLALSKKATVDYADRINKLVELADSRNAIGKGDMLPGTVYEVVFGKQYNNADFTDPAVAEEVYLAVTAGLEANGFSAEVQKLERGVAFSRKQGANPPPEETMLEGAARVAQDKFNRFKVLQDWINESGTKLTDAADVYLAETLMSGRISTRKEDFRNETMGPLIKKTQKANISMEDIADFLKMQHAQEANKRAREIQQKPDATAFGVSDKDAKAALAAFRQRPDFAELQSLANEWRGISTKTKAILLKGGILSPEMSKAWDDTYTFYIPVKGTDEDAAAKTGTGKGLDVNGKTKQRLGHELRDEAIIENILRDHERAISLDEKNNVGKALIKFALEVQNEDIVTVSKPVLRKVLKQGDTAYMVTYHGSDIASFDSYKDAQAYIAQAVLLANNKTTGTKLGYAIDKTNDNVRVMLQASPMLAANEVNVYVAGRAVRIQINDEVAARAYTNLGIEHLNSILSASREVNNWLSKVYTGYSPDFILTNPIRDAIQGAITLTGELGGLTSAKIFANYPLAMKELAKFYSTGKSQLVRDYRANGGSTGGAYLSDLERIGDDIQASYEEYSGMLKTYKMAYEKAISEGKSKKAAHTIASMRSGMSGFKKIPIVGHFLKLMEKLNAMTENALRVATFHTLVKDGMAPQRAAAQAKNLMNFNRKGEKANMAGALYLFYNPSVQGSALIKRAMLEAPHKNQARALAGSMVLAAMAVAALNMGGDDEDKKKWDQTPDHVKDGNIVITRGDKQITITLPYGYRVLWTLGNVISDAFNGKDLDKLSIRMASSVFANFSPFGNPLEGEEGPFQLLPTSLKMAMGPSKNEDSFGRQIAPTKYAQTEPDSQNMNRATEGTMYAKIAEKLNSLTGGSAYEKGAADVSPEVLKYWVKSLTGGTGQFAMDMVNIGAAAAQGEVPEATREMPVIRRFVREIGVADARSAYWDRANEVKEAAGQVGQARKAKDVDGFEDLVDRKGELASLAKFTEGMLKLANSKRDAFDAIRQDDTLSLREKRDMMREIETEEKAIYDEYIAEFDSVTKKK